MLNTMSKHLLKISNFQDRVNNLEIDLIVGRKHYNLCATVLQNVCIDEQKRKSIVVEKYYDRQLIDRESGRISWLQRSTTYLT